MEADPKCGVFCRVHEAAMFRVYAEMESELIRPPVAGVRYHRDGAWDGRRGEPGVRRDALCRHVLHDLDARRP
jgi:hypothetical protein